MTLVTACPKPKKKTDREKRVEQIANAWARTQRGIERAKGKPRTPVKQRNESRIKRRHAQYTKLIRSDFNLRLRYERWGFSQGYCECQQCVEIRRWHQLPFCVTLRPDEGGVGFRSERMVQPPDRWRPAAHEAALTKPEVWFTKKGGEPYKRFRSTEGQLHHIRYGRTEREDPDAIKDVRWMWKEHHRALESTMGTRRRFLSQEK